MNDMKKEDVRTILDLESNEKTHDGVMKLLPIDKISRGQRAGVFEVCLIHLLYQIVTEIEKRYINPQAIVNFGFTLQAAWEASAASFQFSLLNGGPASLVYGSIVAGIGSTAIAISLAEMASL